MEIILHNSKTAVCVKPAGILSTDEPGGMPSLVREQLGVEEVRTVHRLDRVVGGLMVLALDKDTASNLGMQIAERSFEKEYLAVVHNILPESSGTFTDYLERDRRTATTHVAKGPSKEAREAVLDYTVLDYLKEEGLSLVRIKLRTGRTHQIRVQFSSRGYPLWGDRKYGTLTDSGNIALWSYRVAFNMPDSGERADICLPPPDIEPWNRFNIK